VFLMGFGKPGARKMRRRKNAANSAGPTFGEYIRLADYKPMAALNPTRMKVGFTREGYIQLEGRGYRPPPWRECHGRAHWVRERLAGGLIQQGCSRLFFFLLWDFIRFNTVHADQWSTCAKKIPAAVTVKRIKTFKYSGTGDPHSLDSRRSTGLDPEDVGAGGDFSLRQRDPHFTSTGNTAQILFWRRNHGEFPSAGAMIVARQYRFGAERAVKADRPINGLHATHGLARVTNERAAGGRA